MLHETWHMGIPHCQRLPLSASEILSFPATFLDKTGESALP